MQLPPRAWIFGVAFAALSSAALPEALAQQDLALSRFSPSPAGDRFFGVPSAYAASDGTVHAMLLADYAHNPLVLRTAKSDADAGAVVSDQLFLHASGSLAFFRWLTLHLDIPVALAQSGDSPVAGGQAFTSPSSAAFGDLRIGARATLVGEYDDPFQVAFGTSVWLPTGGSGAFVSDGSVRVMPQVIAAGHSDRLVWSLSLGLDLREATTFGGTDQGTMLHLGGAAGWVFGDDRSLQVGPEWTTALVLRDVQKRTTSSEILVGARYRLLDDFELGLGAGPGLSSGIGTPDLRVVFSASYSPKQAPKASDRDGDGVDDERDACPDAAGPESADEAKNGCPKAPPDRDRDGVVDAEDACPEQAGAPSEDASRNGCPGPVDSDGDGIPDIEDACKDVAGQRNQDARQNGCPPDRDRDGVLDADDACPDERGMPNEDPTKHGCSMLLDTDGDGITDDQDACMEEKGPKNADPLKNGCPTSVRVTESEIIILQQVQFDNAAATILPVSDPLLDEVYGVFVDHPEIVRIEVQGHTDSKGSYQGNLLLSQQRAEAVREALIKRGMSGDRLVAKGYGSSVPIADNATPEGRSQNRRVQFSVLEKKAPSAKTQGAR